MKLSDFKPGMYVKILRNAGTNLKLGSLGLVVAFPELITPLDIVNINYYKNSYICVEFDDKLVKNTPGFNGALVRNSGRNIAVFEPDQLEPLLTDEYLYED